MRVIFLSPHSDPQAKLGEPDAGGQCLYEHELAIALAGSGIQVLTFCRQRNHHPPVSHVVPGYTVYRLTAGGENFIPKESIGRVLPEFTSKVNQILSKIKRDSETVIHAHYWDGAAAALYLKANYLDLPLIWTPHSLGFVKREKYHGLSNERLYHFIPRLTWESYGALTANRLVTLSRNEKAKLVNYYGIHPNRVTVIPPGVTIGDQITSAKYLRKWHLSPDTKIMLTIGRMSRNKGYHHALHIADKLRGLYPGKYTLVVVGGGSKISSTVSHLYEQSLKHLSQKLGLTDRVIFQPSVSHREIQSIYAAADLYLMTSEDEPFGMTVVEAMTMGKTVVAHNHGGTKDILVNGQTGFLTDIHDYVRAAELVNQLFRHPYRLERIGERARAAAHAKFSWQSRLPAFLEVYRNAKTVTPTRLKKLLSADQFLSNSLKIV